MRFIALDVETANADMASICSIGAAVFDDGKVVSEFYSLIDPEDYFDAVNVSIHGIDEEMVVGAPTYQKVADRLNEFLGVSIVVTHTHFDRVSIRQASSQWSVEEPSCSWLDSAMIARRTWTECARSGYGLANVCELIGYRFQHHHALEDAKAAGQIVLAATEKSSLDLEGMLRRVRLPINPNDANVGGAIRRVGNPDGPLTGEVIVFTGTLQILRSDAADLAASVGCDVGTSVTKNTTMLVVGDTDVARLAGHDKSSKHRKVEELILKGTPIRVNRETDFQELVSTA
jgi:DNA polymerase III subunit epsilon